LTDQMVLEPYHVLVDVNVHGRDGIMQGEPNKR
jgi:hypothetical protein